MRKYQSGGPVEGKKQDPALVTKAPKIKKEFGLIDWTKPARIHRAIRARDATVADRVHVPASAGQGADAGDCESGRGHVADDDSKLRIRRIVAKPARVLGSGAVLSRCFMRVLAISSGQSLLQFLNSSLPGRSG